MNVERRERWWLVAISYEERYDLIRDGEHPPDHAIAAVASESQVAPGDLHCSEVHTYDGGVEVVVRRR